MARTVTLGQLKQDILEQADLTGASGAGKRYPPTLLNRWVNQSIQHFRQRITTDGATHYLKASSGTTGTGVTSPYAFYLLDLSSITDLVLVYGVDVTESNVIYQLQSVPFHQRNSYGATTNTDRPQAFAAYQRDKLALLPAPDTAYAYTVWYLPSATDLADDTGDTFDGVAGWEDYIVWDVVSRMCVRDKYSETYQLVVNQRDAIMTQIIRDAKRVTMAGGSRRLRDTMGERLFNQRRGYRPPLDGQ